MKRAVLAVLALILTPHAAAGPGVTVDCPLRIRVVAENVPPDWVATAQGAEFPRTQSLITIGGQQMLACHYRLYGGDYVIYRPKPAGYPNCTPAADAWRSQGNFMCRPG